MKTSTNSTSLNRQETVTEIAVAKSRRDVPAQEVTALEEEERRLREEEERWRSAAACE